MTKKILYKYSAFDCRSLSLFKNKEIYFSDPKHLNDPVDCQIGISGALKHAIKTVEKEEPGLKEKLEAVLGTLSGLEKTYDKIENDVKRAGVFSLSADENNVLLWSHYADSHEGFSIGFSPSPALAQYNKSTKIVGMNSVGYSNDNPFVEYFVEFARCAQPPEWEQFWMVLFSIGFTHKSTPWAYEKEWRIIKHRSGKLKFDASEICVVIFGLKMKEKNRRKIRKLLSGDEWNHVQFKEVIRANDGFTLNVMDC